MHNSNDMNGSNLSPYLNLSSTVVVANIDYGSSTSTEGDWVEMYDDANQTPYW